MSARTMQKDDDHTSATVQKSTEELDAMLSGWGAFLDAPSPEGYEDVVQEDVQYESNGGGAESLQPAGSNWNVMAPAFYSVDLYFANGRQGTRQH